MSASTSASRSHRMLVISAHAADFMWRAAVAIAVTTTNDGSASVLALSYGERGESGELWKEPGQTVERVKQIRPDETTRAATALGADFSCLDLGDYPLLLDAAAIDRLTAAIIERAPDVIITHTDRDPFNPDHPVAYSAVERARQLASGAGVASAFTTIRPPALLLFEPHQPELCGFVPTTFLDITPVFAQKEEAMGAWQHKATCASSIMSAPSTAPIMRAAFRATSTFAMQRRSCAFCRRWSANYDRQSDQRACAFRRSDRV